MKRLKNFWILSFSQVLILLLYLLLQSVFVNQSFNDFYYLEKEKTMLAEASIIEIQISKFINDPPELQKLISNLAKKTDARITVILLSGRVVAESHISLDKLDNHKNRPEIKAALEGKNGISRRFSDTLNEETLYLATPILNQNKEIGVLRISKSMANLKTSLSEIFSKFFTGSLVITLVLVLIIVLYTKNLNLSLEKMSFITQKYLKGDYFEKIKISPWDSLEISSLAKSLNKMGGQIEIQIAKILKQQKELEAVFLSMTEGVLTIDQHKRVYHINNSAKKIFNLDLEKEYKGTPLEEVIRNKKVEDFFEEVSSSNIFLKKEFELNDRQIYQVNGSTLTGEKNDIFGALLVFNDISDIRKLEQHRKEFVANVSHELRTPLTTINGYLENILDGTVDSREDQEKFLKIVQKHSLRLQKIIEDLLILSQVEVESNRDFSGEVMDICAILSSVKSLFNGNIIIDCEKNLKTKINSHLLEIAINNLLQNAIRYGKKDAPIILAAKTKGGNIEISVTDQGIGIAPEHHGRLFERFYSVDKSRSRDFGGSGLGLSIVKHIALAHNGSVDIKSSPGKGSTFSIILPKVS
jgi:two-component system phosphate regulon sensor histidine kinase PhoR